MVSLKWCTKYKQKVLSLMYFGYPGMKSLPLFFNIISLNLEALSPSLFQLDYLSKTEVFTRSPKYCNYDTFIASFIMRCWAMVLPLHALLFRLLIIVTDTSLMLGHDSVHKFLRVILILRQEKPRNSEPVSPLIFSGDSGDLSSQDLGHSKDVG